MLSLDACVPIVSLDVAGVIAIVLKFGEDFEMEGFVPYRRARRRILDVDILQTSIGYHQGAPELSICRRFFSKGYFVGDIMLTLIDPSSGIR